ncbi:MAG: NAD(P)H-hydrate epimerase, partial [Cytophagaceae bacterium]|nr:NAD(P)H-hydrate epimerase [Gemmatimonadaceae bacterium]
MHVPVLTAAQSARRDRLEIDAGTPSLELMRRAGECAARVVTERLPSECTPGVSIFVGAGNNGGDGWIVARDLLGRGLRVAVHVVAPPGTSDARAAASLVDVARLAEIGAPGVVIDALLGTGAHGPPRDDISAAFTHIARLREHGAVVVSLDIPSGVDAALDDRKEGLGMGWCGERENGAGPERGIRYRSYGGGPPGAQPL